MKTAIKVTKMEFLAPSQEVFRDCLSYMFKQGIKMNGFIIHPFKREEFRDHPNINNECDLVADQMCTEIMQSEKEE